MTLKASKMCGMICMICLFFLTLRVTKAHSLQKNEENIQEDYYQSAMAEIITDYLKIRKKLSGDSLDGVSELALDIAKKAEKTNMIRRKFRTRKPENHEKYSLIRGAGQHAYKLTKGDINIIRKDFVELGRPIILYVKKFGAPADIEDKLLIYYCPMYPGYWLQEENQTGNPLYGKKMIKCASLVEGKEKEKKMMRDLSKFQSHLKYDDAHNKERLRRINDYRQRRSHTFQGNGRPFYNH